MEKRAAPFAVQYVNRLAVDALLAQNSSVLGAVGYGAQRPEFFPAACPFVAAPLSPVTGDPMFEIWTASAPIRPCWLGRVSAACNDDMIFGAVILDESGQAAFEEAVERAYCDIFDLLEKAGFAAPIRFWNYLLSITKDDQGLERYRRFNIGRHRAFSSRLQQKIPPAASCVGGHHGASVIYFLAAREPAWPVENPRQVSAYDYPPIYGPSSPSFSRASVYAQGGVETLLISGTASIVGHETRHPGDLNGQIATTMENLRVLIGAAGQTTPQAAAGWALKIYLHESADRAAVNNAIDTLFGTDSQRLYLHGDICRPELLIEIEAFHSGFRL